MLPGSLSRGAAHKLSALGGRQVITGEQPGMISLLGKGLYLEILSWEHRISDLKEFFKDYPVQTSDVINQTQGDLPAL